MKILIFGNYNGGKQFFDELSEWLTKVGYNVDMLDWGIIQLFTNNFTNIKRFKAGFVNKLFSRIPSSKVQFFLKNQLRKKALRSLCNDYDIVNIHYGNANNNKFIKLLREKGKKLVVSIWGSDYHRLPDEKKQKARKLYDSVDLINFGNPEMRDDFIVYYGGYENKAAIAGFGDNKFSRINDLMKLEKREESRSKVGIPENSFVITCGYKAFHVLQHFEMIDAVEKNINYLPENYLLIFPLTYHKNADYLSKLKKRLSESGLNYKCYDNFLSEDEICRIRISSDVYMTIPESDAASSSMLEYLLAGNVVIAGEWLPYQLHKKVGLYFHSSSLDGLADKLMDILNNFSEYKNKTKVNKKIVLDNFSWSIKIKAWQQMFDSIALK